MRFSLCLLVLVVLFEVTNGHWNWLTGKRRKSKSKPFTNLLCRIRHYKTLLNENNQVVGCKKSCPTDYQERYSLHWGHHCKKIAKPTGCADQYCVRCDTGFKWLYTFPYNQRCVKECPPGHMENQGQCSLCVLQDCAECTGVWQCTKCNRGFALYKTVMDSNICLPSCPKRYNKEILNGIATCVKSKVVKTTKTTTATTTTTTTTTAMTTPTTVAKANIIEITTTKKVLPNGCKDKNCVNCQPGFYKYYPVTKGSLCLQECPVGHAALSGVCVACADRRCASCKTSISECDRCYPSYSMVLDSANITLECVQSCPQGYKQQIIDSVKMCLQLPEPECPITNCARCVSQKIHGFHKGCAQCKTGYTLFRGSFNDHCYTDCPPGFFKLKRPGTTINVCEKCGTPFCNKCVDEKICTECVEPMVLDPITKRCTTCPPLRQFNFETKTCIMPNLNEPESNFG